MPRVRSSGLTLPGSPLDLDRARYLRRIRDPVRAAAPGLLGQAPILTGPAGRVLVPVPWEAVPEFRRRAGALAPEVGQGPGEPGDVVARAPSPSGTGAAGGSEDGGLATVAIDRDEFLDLVLGDLRLPALQPRRAGPLVEDHPRWVSQRPRGPQQRLDPAATVRAAQRRRQVQGPEAPPLLQRDLRYRSWRTRPQPVAQAVLGLLRDVSGSMDADHTRLTLGVAWWMVQALRRVYPRLALDFWTHTTSPAQVDETTWWHQGGAGGTAAASAYVALADAWRVAYPAAAWNWYVVHFTDGDDSQPGAVAAAIRAAWPAANLLGVVELRVADHTPGPGPKSALGRALAGITLPPVRVVTVTTPDDAGAALRALWGEASS